MHAFFPTVYRRTISTPALIGLCFQWKLYTVSCPYWPDNLTQADCLVTVLGKKLVERWRDISNMITPLLKMFTLYHRRFTRFINDRDFCYSSHTRVQVIQTQARTPPKPESFFFFFPGFFWTSWLRFICDDHIFNCLSPAGRKTWLIKHTPKFRGTYCFQVKFNFNANDLLYLN